MPTAEANPERTLTETRRAVYHFLLAALDRPTPEQHVWLRGPAFPLLLDAVGEPFGLTVPDGELFPASFVDHESRYLACFEVGLPAPPVPLLASHYNPREPVPRIIHEHVLFYHRFGVRLVADASDPADHLLHELAFLIRLDEMLQEQAVEEESLLRGRRDFLKRQMERWPGRAAAAAEEKRLPPVYCCLLALLAAAIAQDLELSETAVADLERKQS